MKRARALFIALCVFGLACGSAATETEEPTDANSANDTSTTADTSTTDSTSATDGTSAIDAPPPTYPPAPDKLGGDRPAPYYLPDTYTPEKSWPMLILLHGYSASGAVQNMYLGVSKHVDEREFILVVPDGTTNPQGLKFWNATPACCDNYGSGVDDQGYLVGLIDEAQQYFNVDAERVSLLGHSNGGFMSYRMACHAGDRIAAIASIAGSSYRDEADCPGTEPVSILQIHGTEDPTILYEGVPKLPTYAGYPGAEENASRWRARNQCSDTPDVMQALDMESIVVGDETDATHWTQCANGAQVALWKMNAVGHVPIFGPAFMPAVLDFLLGTDSP